MSATFVGSHLCEAIIPTVADHQGSQLQHRFVGRFFPEDAVAFQSQIDHAADAALDRSAAQRKSETSETRVRQRSGFAVTTKIGDLRQQLRVRRVVVGQFLKISNH